MEGKELQYERRLKKENKGSVQLLICPWKRGCFGYAMRNLDNLDRE